MTIVGNLVDNAFDAVAEVSGPAGCASTPGWRAVTPCSWWRTPGPGLARRPGPGLRARLLDQGGERSGRRGIGLALVAQSVQRLGGGVLAGPARRQVHGAPSAGRWAVSGEAAASLGVLRVLVVEDEPIAAEAHTAYVERVPGFVVAATVGTSQAALQALQEKQVDVVLLDMNLPDRHGLEVLRAMRAGGHRADVIAVTSARDLDVVRSAVSLGVVQYVPSLRLRDAAGAPAGLPRLPGAGAGGRPGGYAGRGRPGHRRAARQRRDAPAEGHERGAALARVASPPRGGEGISASELGDAVGVSRVTARRYAEFLCESRLAVRRSRYVGPGVRRWSTGGRGERARGRRTGLRGGGGHDHGGTAWTVPPPSSGPSTAESWARSGDWRQRRAGMPSRCRSSPWTPQSSTSPRRSPTRSPTPAW